MWSYLSHTNGFQFFMIRLTSALYLFIGTEEDGAAYTASINTAECTKRDGGSLLTMSDVRVSRMFEYRTFLFI